MGTGIGQSQYTDFQVDVPEIAATETLRDQHRLAAWVPNIVQPTLLIEACRLNN